MPVKALLLAMILLASADLVLTHGTYTARCIHGIAWAVHNIVGDTRDSIFSR